VVGIAAFIAILVLIGLMLRALARRTPKRAADIARITSIPIPPGAVTPDATSVLQQRGWQRKAAAYCGPFATPYGTWDGQVEPAGGRFRCYIKNPPMHVIARHPKAPCFHRYNDGWWSINLQQSPVDSDPAAVILHIERLISEAHRLADRA
jgi:hypothetical protein